MSSLRDLVYPPTCSGCGERGVWLCERCLASLPSLERVPGRCRTCGIPVVRSRCGCGSLHPRIGRAVSGYPYAGWVANAIRGVKYGGEKDRAAFLGALLASTGAGDVVKEADVVVPVPMHRGREAERGYNQAAVMAESLCRALSVAPPVFLLAQPEKRPSQVGLSASDRRMNMRGAFVVQEGDHRLRGSRVVLVDDVRTTGSTLNACVDALRPYRPAGIDVVTFSAELSDEAIAEVLSVARSD